MSRPTIRAVAIAAAVAMATLCCLAPPAPACRIVQIAAAGRHCMALREDGTVWSWGAQSPTKVTATRRHGSVTPEPRPELSNIVAVAAGDGVLWALGADGTLWRWFPFVFDPVPEAAANLGQPDKISYRNGHHLALGRMGP